MFTLMGFYSSPLSLTSSSTANNQVKVPPPEVSCSSLSSPPRSGLCRASQAVELFPTISSEVTVRDVRLEDCWEVADTHCSSFFPKFRFPLDLALRINRFLGLVSGFSAPPGCHRTCLVAVTGFEVDTKFSFGSKEVEIKGFEGGLRCKRGSVAGILTLDTVADFLPRKGPQKKRRSGIAYMSNVAVRDTQRRKGIAKRLISSAEERAMSWGCHAVALHCDARDSIATSLYEGQGFRRIKVPEGANWPTPTAAPGFSKLGKRKLRKLKEKESGVGETEKA